MNNNINFLFGTQLPKSFVEMLSHPILFVLCIIILGLGFIEVKRKLQDGEWTISKQSSRAIVIVAVFLMMFIATR
jgi:hypothetical protein